MIKQTKSNIIMISSIIGCVSQIGDNATKTATYGHTASTKPIKMLKNAKITDLSISLTEALVAGTCRARIKIKDAKQNYVKQMASVTISAIENKAIFKATIMFATPISYSAHDTIVIDTITIDAAPTRADAIIKIDYVTHSSTI